MKTVQLIASLMPTVIASIFFCGNATAHDADGPPQRVVSYADLNLDNSAGVKVLYRRLSQAARAVCQPMPSAPFLRKVELKRCERNAMNDAIATINNANLTAYYNERTRGTKDADEKLAARR
jgi:UrcA family protein